MLRIVADLGNSRLKWGRVDGAGKVVESLALPNDDAEAWAAAWSLWNPPQAASEWAITTVNPPVATELASFLADRQVDEVTWYRSAADVPDEAPARGPGNRRGRPGTRRGGPPWRCTPSDAPD